MARFRIVNSTLDLEQGVTSFEIEWLDGQLTVGDSFLVFDTHHPIECRIMSIVESSSGALLKCQLTIGWNGQFSRAIIDTTASDKWKKFRYE